MKKTLIFGINQFAELLYDYMTEDGTEIVAFVIDQKYSAGQKSFCEKPIVFTENILSEFPPEQYNVIVALGYSKMNSIRKAKAEEFKKMGYEIIGYQHPTALVMADDIGEGNVFFENVTIGKHTKIGNGNIFYACAHIAHHSEIRDFNFFAISCSVAGNVQIGSNCFVGNNATLKNRIKVDDYTLIGAGCYLKENTQKAGGVYVPAKSVLLEEKNSIDMI